MTKIKFDVSGSKPEDAQNLSIEQPRPGVYRFKVKEINTGYSKDSNGKPDESRPRVEVIWECQDKRYKGAQVWQYLTFNGEFPLRKYDNFLQAFGVATTRKRKGEWDSEKVVNKTALVTVRAGTNQAGEYRAEVGSVAKDDGRDLEVEGDGDELLDENEEMVEDEEMVDEDEAEEFDAEARTAELTGATVADLKAIATEYGISASGKKKSEVVAEIVAYESEAGAEAEEDDEMMDEEEEEEEEESESESIYLTDDDLKAMDAATLRATAGEFDVVTKGKKRSEVISAILEAQAAPEAEEAPF